MKKPKTILISVALNVFLLINYGKCQSTITTDSAITPRPVQISSFKPTLTSENLNSVNSSQNISNVINASKVVNSNIKSGSVVLLISEIPSSPKKKEEETKTSTTIPK